MASRLLLVVDIQNGFINKHTDKLVPKIAKLAALWQQRDNGPIIYSRFVNLEGGPWERYIGWSKLKAEPETLLDKRLPIKGSDIFKKGTYSAWSSELNQVCQAHKVEEVVICGVDTDQCVLATAIDVFQANLRPLVVEDLCASSAGDDYHQAALKIIKRLIGVDQLISLPELGYEI